MLGSYFLAIPVFLPIIAGVMLLIFPEKETRKRNMYTFIVSILNMAIVIAICIWGVSGSFRLIGIGSSYKVELLPDSFGRFFGCLVSVLWPLSLLYAYEYMETEERCNSFFAFFTMTLGAVIGVSFSGDLFSMYIFYEFLSLFTFPLVMHAMSEEAMKAGRKYLTYMLGGAAFSLVGMIVIMNMTATLDFRIGGVMENVNRTNTVIFLFVMIFCGFAVKAAMMPFGKWLIYAAVAPTPVTALLHAVAVVKAGAFACLRLIYYVFGADYLKDTWGQYTIIILTSVTILYGSTMAVKEQHIKRRLAYSTISNLSYILLAGAFMTTAGFTAALAHLFAHAVTKIGLFFCIGSIMHVTGKCYVYEIDGLGRKMKWIFGCFTIAALSLTGIPQFLGFISKYRILDAAVENGSPFAYIGASVVIISALLTAVYLFTICIRAYFPVDGKLCENYAAAHDPGIRMLLPIVLSAIATFVFGIYWQPIINVIDNILL